MTDPVDPHRDLAGVLHDVSNTLTVLLGWVAEARAPGASHEQVVYALQVIEQRARVARDLARHAIGGPRIDERRDLSSVLDELVRGLDVEAQRARVGLVLEGLPRSGTKLDDAAFAPKIEGALDLSQVLTNVILNAFAHAPPGSTVRVVVEVEPERCTIAVSDEGPGVTPERRESIFQGDTQRAGGAGIGLRHSRALARSRGGDLTLVDARAGACFRLRWPRVDAIPRAPVSTARVRDLEGLRVLVVEDDPAVTDLLEASLQARGAVVTVATSREKLDDALGHGPFDGVLVDLSPIEADVEGALAAMRAELPGAAIVLVTGNADVLPDAVRAESAVLVRKPFELHEVAAALLRARSTKAVDEDEKEE